MSLEDAEYLDRFAGVGRVLGERALARLREAHVAVIGIGGVGSWTAEALARTGVGRITLVDLDDVCVTNTNRQVLALTETVGQSKVEVMATRLRAIWPGMDVRVVQDFFTPATSEAILADDFDVVIDCIDAYRDKLHLVECARARRLPLVVVGGAGGRVDPLRLQVADLNRSSGDALLKRLRRDLRGRPGFDRMRPWRIPTVFTDEPRRFPGADGEPCAIAQPNARMDCRQGLGALTWVTGTMGFIAAREAVALLMQEAKATRPEGDNTPEVGAVGDSADAE